MVVEELYRDAADNEGARSSFTFDSSIIEKALRNIQSKRINTRTTIDAGLFSEVQRIVSNAIDIGYDAPAGGSSFAQELKNNAEVWSAFKVHRMGRDIAARMLDSDGNLKSFEQFKADTKDIVDHQVGRWLRTEFDTAVKRAHKAAEMRQFMEEADVFPNIEWLPSSAVNPRESHIPFYHHIWPIDDPFWNEHKPGDEWGCQCDWRATDEAPTDNTGLGSNNIKPSAGLGGNPARTGQIFSNDHPYFPSDCAHCAFKSVQLRLFTNKQKNCYQCANIIKAIKSAKLAPVIEEYKRLRADENYTDVKIDRKSGGLSAVHREHKFDPAEGCFGIPRGEYERLATEILRRNGHRVILEIEYDNKKTPDGTLNGGSMDIKSVEGSGKWTIKNHLAKANEQFAENNKVGTVILYFHKADGYSPLRIEEGWHHYFIDKHRKCGQNIKEVWCVVEDVIYTFTELPK